MIFSARASGGPKRPTTPTYGAAGENFWGMEEMVYDIAIKTPPTHPKNLRLRSWKRSDLMLRSDLLIVLN